MLLEVDPGGTGSLREVRKSLAGKCPNNQSPNVRLVSTHSTSVGKAGPLSYCSLPGEGATTGSGWGSLDFWTALFWFSLPFLQLPVSWLTGGCGCDGAVDVVVGLVDMVVVGALDTCDVTDSQ